MIKLVDEINKLLTPRQANAGTKNQKKECPGCGVKVPIYQGRYPGHCPGCNMEFGESISEKIIAMNLSELEDTLRNISIALQKMAGKERDSEMKKLLTKASSLSGSAFVQVSDARKRSDEIATS
jgi:hypothetical protein